MHKVWIHFTLFLTLLCGGAFGAFIQSPIPPSTKQNFLRDTNNDGRLDKIEVRFLGAISEEYLDQMVDSLVFDWLDTNGVRTYYTITQKQMAIDSVNPRLVVVDLAKQEREFLPITGRARMDYAGVRFGGLTLFVADSVEYTVNLRDGMMPAVSYAHLKSFQGKGPDTLKLDFTESVEFVEGCNAYFEFKGEKDTTIRVLPMGNITWDNWMTGATIELPENLPVGETLSTRDSIRFLNGCVRDTVKNVVSNQAKFFPVTGYYPYSVTFPVLAVDRRSSLDDSPVFQLEFDDATEEDNDSLWRISMNVMGAEFENALREYLRLNEKAPIDYGKLSFHCNVKIYTNHGSYVVGTKMVVKGDDSRFTYSPTRLSLRWNFMDGNRRRVATGAYLANVLVSVEYDGEVVFRNDSETSSVVRMFGVIRR